MSDVPAAMPAASRASRLLRIAAVLVVAYAIVYAIEPFSISSVTGVSGPPATGIQAPSGVVSTYLISSSATHCGVALKGAWRADRPASGWFGYAPMTNTTTPTSGCRGASRRRLGFSFAGGVLGVGCALLARRTDRNSGDEADR
jgi:hypothetical protein